MDIANTICNRRWNGRLSANSSLMPCGNCAAVATKHRAVQPQSCVVLPRRPAGHRRDDAVYDARLGKPSAAPFVALCLLYGLPGVVLTEYFHKRGLAIRRAFVLLLWWCWCRWRCTACSGDGFVVARSALPRLPLGRRALTDKWGWRSWRREPRSLWRYRYPFLLMPMAVTLWCISIDTPNWLIYGKRGCITGCPVTIDHGLALALPVGVVTDHAAVDACIPAWRLFRCRA